MIDYFVLVMRRKFMAFYMFEVFNLNTGAYQLESNMIDTYGEVRTKVRHDLHLNNIRTTNRVINIQYVNHI